MDNNSTNLLTKFLIDNLGNILSGIGFIIAGVVAFVVNNFWNDLKELKMSFNNLRVDIAKLETHLNTLEDKKGLHGQVKEIHDDFIDKLRQQANDLYNSTKAQLDCLAADIAQQQTKADASLEALKTQEASLTVLTERAQRLPQEIEPHLQQLQSTKEAEFARLTNDIDKQLEQMKQALSQQETNLRAEVDKIQDESIRKLHDSTQERLDQLATNIARQQNASLQVLKTQEASSLTALKERAQESVQLAEIIQQRAQVMQKIEDDLKKQFVRLTADIDKQRAQVMQALSQQETTLLAEVTDKRAQVKQEIEEEMEALRQEKVSTRLAGLEAQVERLEDAKWLWWYQLDEQWQAIFKETIGTESEPTEDELVEILSLTELDCSDKELTSLEPLRVWTGLQTLDCQHNHLTSLEPLRALTGLQTLICFDNQLTNLEPLHGLKSLKSLWCQDNPSLSSQEIERFKKAVPSCEVE